MHHLDLHYLEHQKTLFVQEYFGTILCVYLLIVAHIDM